MSDGDPADAFPADMRARFEVLPPFIQDGVRRGAKMQPAMNDDVCSGLGLAASASDWSAAEPLLASLAPKLPPETVLESLLFFFAVANDNPKAELVRSLLDLLAATEQKRVKSDPAKSD